MDTKQHDMVSPELAQTKKRLSQIDLTSCFNWYAPAGFEPATYGLEVRGGINSLKYFYIFLYRFIIDLTSLISYIFKLNILQNT